MKSIIGKQIANVAKLCNYIIDNILYGLNEFSFFNYIKSIKKGYFLLLRI